jgi:ectoine hydroxylase-related dioxygenase (phytanoyl-CoA dioxygenase family)
MSYKLQKELDNVGYAIVENVANITNKDVINLEQKISHSHTLHNNINGNNDYKRSQVHFSSLDVPTFVKNYEQNLLGLLPKYSRPLSSIIKSYENCKEQNAHVDYNVDGRFLSKLKSCKRPPLNALLSLQRNTRLKVYPQSHKLMCRSYKVLRRSKRIQKTIKPIYIKIPVGSAVIFRGDCVHAGCSYKKVNKRIHTFLTPTNEPYSDCLPGGIDEVLTKNMCNFIKDVIVE